MGVISLILLMYENLTFHDGDNFCKALGHFKTRTFSKTEKHLK